MTPKALRLIRRLHGMLGSENPQERETAHKKLLAALKEQGFTWNDLSAVLRAAEEAERADAAAKRTRADAPPPSPDEPPPTPSSSSVPPLDLVMRLIELNVWITPEQRLAVALWILYTHIFSRNLFNISPRLLLTSPVPGCGKTTLLKLLQALTANAELSDNVTAASIYHDLDPWKPTPTLLLDEGDNLGLLNDRVLKAVLNSGRRQGGVFKRYSGKGVRKFEVFTPLALAAIYDDYGLLPRPLLQRCIWIEMHRPTPDEEPAERFDEIDPQFLNVRDATQNALRAWAANCQLNRNPEVPLRLRGADNWRPLLAIADDLGYGAAARTAAVALSGIDPEQTPAQLLLTAIRDVFTTRNLDRIFGATLVEALLEPEEGPWREWRGVRDDKPPHKLTQSELTRALVRFGIGAHPVWPLGPRGQRGTSHMGYYRSDFAQTWARYCPQPKTPKHQNAPAALPKSPKPPPRGKRKSTRRTKSTRPRRTKSTRRTKSARRRHK